MALDLGPILDVTGGSVGDVLGTAGTLVTITRPAVVQSVDPATAAATAPAVVVVASEVPALVLLDNPGSLQASYPGALPAEDPRWKVITGPDVTGVLRGDHVTVTESRDERLIGRSFEVTLVQDGSAGVARVAFCRAVPERGRT